MDLMLWEKPVFTLSCPPFGEVRAGVCRKISYDKILLFMQGKSVCFKEIIKEIIPGINENLLTVSGAFVFFRNYIEAVEKYCEENMDIFKAPEHIDFDEDREEIALPVISCPMHIIYEYSGLDFGRINELDILDYRLLLADGIKLKILSRADGRGREILRECYECMHKNSDIFG